jgi:chromosomal replication initiator protein
MASIRRDFERLTSAFAKNIAIIYENDPWIQAVRTGRPEYSLPAAADSGKYPGNGEHGTFSIAHAAESDAGPFALPDNQDIFLHKQYTFDTFLVNRKNDFPLVAAKECVSKASRPLYTPFVVYGQSGAGKSHLLGAMANALRYNGKALYFGSIAYLERITAAPGRHASIAEQYVFIDDAQRILACHDTQDALAALIDIFQASGKLLALSFDAHPAQYVGLGQKLRSRLVGGLVMEIKRPDMDIRRQYVQCKNTAHNFGLSKEQILAISHRYQDIRGIDGALARLSAYRDLMAVQGTDTAPSDISSILDREGEHSFLTPGAIILTVAREFSLPPEELTGKNKDKTVSLARHIAILLCRELLGLSLIQTGRIFAGRDHSSVLYSIKKIKQLQEGDKVMNKRVEDLRKLCLTKH